MTIQRSTLGIRPYPAVLPVPLICVTRKFVLTILPTFTELYIYPPAMLSLQ